MFRDASEELARLEAELLAAEEETPEQSFPEEDEYFDDYEDEYDDYEDEDYPVYTDGYQAYNTDVSDEDLDSYSESVRKGTASRGLLVTALILCLLTLAVVSLIAYGYTQGYLG